MTMVLSKQQSHQPPTIFSSSPTPDISEDSVLWKPKDSKYQSGLFGLNAEIHDFVNYITPSADEQWARQFVIARITKCIHTLWPNQVRVEVCGSFATNLYLPTSDIDLVLFGPWDADRLPLDLLKNHLESHDIASSIKVLSRATVPIVKIVDKDTDINIDISFNMENSLRAVKLITSYLSQHRCLRYLVLVLKQFLQQRDLNEVFTGGLSSYALILMCVSFLQHNVKPVDLEKVNLGVLLIEFLELYGQRFNYKTTAIKVTDGGSYCRKFDLFPTAELLCIQDPLNAENDLGRRTFGMLQVKQAFEYAFTVLRSGVLPQYQPLYVDSSVHSLLGRIIRIPQRTLAKRDQLHEFVEMIRNKIKLNLSKLVPQPSLNTPSHVVNGPSTSITQDASTRLTQQQQQSSSGIPDSQSESKSSSTLQMSQQHLHHYIPHTASGQQSILLNPHHHSNQPAFLSSYGPFTPYSNPISFLPPGVGPVGFPFIYPTMLGMPPPGVSHFPIAIPTYNLPCPTMTLMQVPTSSQVNGVSNYLPQNNDPRLVQTTASYSSCSPKSSTKSSTVSSGVEDSSEEQTAASEKNPAAQDTHGAGDGPETSPRLPTLPSDAGVKSMTRYAGSKNSKMSGSNNETPTPSGDQDLSEWPTTSDLNMDEAFPHPSGDTMSAKTSSRKNRSQAARKFDPSHYRLRGNFALVDPGIRKVESTRATSSPFVAAAKNASSCSSNGNKATKAKNFSLNAMTALRSSSEETEQRGIEQTAMPSKQPSSSDQASVASKRKRLQISKN